MQDPHRRQTKQMSVEGEANKNNLYKQFSCHMPCSSSIPVFTPCRHSYLYIDLFWENAVTPAPPARNDQFGAYKTILVLLFYWILFSHIHIFLKCLQIEWRKDGGKCPTWQRRCARRIGFIVSVRSRRELKSDIREDGCSTCFWALEWWGGGLMEGMERRRGERGRGRG